MDTNDGMGHYVRHNSDGTVTVKLGEEHDFANYNYDQEGVWAHEDSSSSSSSSSGNAAGGGGAGGAAEAAESGVKVEQTEDLPPPEPPPAGTSVHIPQLTNEVNITTTGYRSEKKITSIFTREQAKRLVGKVPANVVEADLPNGFRTNWKDHPLAPQIDKAIDRELQDMLVLRDGESTVDPPEHIFGEDKDINLMFVFTAKGDKDGMFEKVKARCVVLGNQERTQLSKMQAYSPVANPISFRTMLAVHVGEPGVFFRQLDIGQAYLSSKMKRRVFIRHPPGYVFYVDPRGFLNYRDLQPGERPPRTALRLRRALYGGMECGRLFFEALREWHVAQGFVQVHQDKCLYLLWKGTKYIKIVFHVDDGACACNCKPLWAWYLNKYRT